MFFFCPFLPRFPSLGHFDVRSSRLPRREHRPRQARRAVQPGRILLPSARDLYYGPTDYGHDGNYCGDHGEGDNDPRDRDEGHTTWPAG